VGTAGLFCGLFRRGGRASRTARHARRPLCDALPGFLWPPPAGLVCRDSQPILRTPLHGRRVHTHTTRCARSWLGEPTLGTLSPAVSVRIAAHAGASRQCSQSAPRAGPSWATLCRCRREPRGAHWEALRRRAGPASEGGHGRATGRRGGAAGSVRRHWRRRRSVDPDQLLARYVQHGRWAVGVLNRPRCLKTTTMVSCHPPGPRPQLHRRPGPRTTRSSYVTVTSLSTVYNSRITAARASWPLGPPSAVPVPHKAAEAIARAPSLLGRLR